MKTLPRFRGPTLLMFMLALLPGLRASPPEWRAELDRQLPLLGHRNWIAIVDSAYPLQNSAGIVTLATEADQLEVARAVLHGIQASPHVRAKVYLDAELNHVPEASAPGIAAYRDALKTLLQNQATSRIPHGAIIRQLDEAGRSFRVFVLKSKLTLPYTSVFIELDCGYWRDQDETALRQAMAGKQ